MLKYAPKHPPLHLQKNFKIFKKNLKKIPFFGTVHGTSTDELVPSYGTKIPVPEMVPVRYPTNYGTSFLVTENGTSTCVPVLFPVPVRYQKINLNFFDFVSKNQFFCAPTRYFAQHRPSPAIQIRGTIYFHVVTQ